jgi:4-hydroxybenzoate polyprenyltransferase
MIAAYLRDRFRPAVFVPVATAIAAAASAGRPGALRLAADVGFALLLLAEFRIRDDLADRDNDAISHPQRVMVRAASVTPFQLLAGSLAAANVLICTVRSGAWIAVPALLALHATLAALYSGRTRRTFAGDQLLLAKYPAFVLILAASRVLESPLPIAVAAGLVYAAASLYEAWHDPASPAAALIGGRS